MLMKKIFYVIPLIALAFSYASCQDEIAADQKSVISISLEGQPDADLSYLQADVEGASYNLCIETDCEYEVALSGAFARQWITLGERKYDADKGCDVLPVVVAPIYHSASSTIDSAVSESGVTLLEQSFEHVP